MASPGGSLLNLSLWKDEILAHAEYPIHTSFIEGVNDKNQGYQADGLWLSGW